MSTGNAAERSATSARSWSDKGYTLRKGVRRARKTRRSFHERLHLQLLGAHFAHCMTTYRPRNSFAMPRNTSPHQPLPWAANKTRNSSMQVRSYFRQALLCLGYEALLRCLHNTHALTLRHFPSSKKSAGLQHPGLAHIHPHQGRLPSITFYTSATTQ